MPTHRQPLFSCPAARAPIWCPQKSATSTAVVTERATHPGLDAGTSKLGRSLPKSFFQTILSSRCLRIDRIITRAAHCPRTFGTIEASTNSWCCCKVRPVFSCEKPSVQKKPQAFIENGYIFASTNYRLFPKVMTKEDDGFMSPWLENACLMKSFRLDPDSLQEVVEGWPLFLVEIIIATVVAVFARASWWGRLLVPSLFGIASVHA